MVDLVRSKFPNCKLAISNVITKKNKNEIDKKWIHSIVNSPNFAKRTKIDIIDSKNQDNSCLISKQLHLNRKDNSSLANNFLDYLDCL